MSLLIYLKLYRFKFVCLIYILNEVLYIAIIINLEINFFLALHPIFISISKRLAFFLFIFSYPSEYRKNFNLLTFAIYPRDSEFHI